MTVESRTARALLVSSRIWSYFAVVAFGAGALILFCSAPHYGEFWWSDSPRHALNGVFLGDFFSTWPADPKSWAMQYYVKYPALTILFYPPLFYLICAPFYLVFGVSHATALAVVEIHYFALALALFFLTRRWVGPLAAIALGLSIMAAPGVALWGRQVMLEVPSLAFLTWSMVALSSYFRTRQNVLLYVASLLILAATYTKINAAIVLPAMGLALLTERKRDLLFDKHVWFATLLVALGLIPITLLTLKFGSANVQSVVGVADSQVSRRSLSGWLWYARHLPGLLGWPLLGLAIASPLLALWRPSRLKMARADIVLLALWFVIGYLALSSIDLKEARHALLIVPPVLVSAGLALTLIWPRSNAPRFVFLAVVLGTGIYTLEVAPVPSVSGYRAAAQWISAHVPKNAIVVFSGKRDGSFVFNLRTIPGRQDISTVRVDKLLLTISVRRELGVAAKKLSGEQIAQMLDNDGVSYVVAQADFWTDIPVMKEFQHELESSHFAKLTSIAVVANVSTEDKVLNIYKNLGQVNPHPKPFEMPLAIIGSSVKGSVVR